MRLAALLIATLATGCALGGSSSVVGRWRPRRVVDSTVCLQSQAPGGGCHRQVTVGRDLPARRFATFLVAWASPGYAIQRGGGERGHGLAIDNYLEYVRGRGRHALAVRAGATVSSGFGERLYVTTPVSLIGHLGAGWGSLYAGAGYSPVASSTTYVGEGEDRMPLPAAYHHDSFHVLAGSRFWLTRTLERGLSLAPELRVQTFAGSVMTSLTCNVGVHL